MAKKKQTTSSVSGSSNSVQNDPAEKPFTPETLDRTIIALPLLDKIRNAKPSDQFDIIIDVNLEYAGGRTEARKILWQWVDELPEVRRSKDVAAGGGSVPAPPAGKAQGIDASKSKYSQQYLFGRLSAANIRALVQRNEQARRETANEAGKPGPSALYRIWQDDAVRRFTNLSISTVKADAARNAFSTSGKDIVWAVVDTGIDREHLHF